jgi:hypothetical protein
VRKLLLALATSILVCGPAVAAGPDNSTWPMMHGGPQRVSTSTVTGPRQIKRSWVQSSGATYYRNYAGPIIGSDNTIYVGGHEIFYALNPDGTVKWTANEQASGGETFGTPGVGDNSQVYISTLGSVFSYNTGSSGVANFVSSSAVVGAGNRSAGSGSVMIAPNGNVLVSHGDEQRLPSGVGGASVYSGVFPAALGAVLGQMANGPSSPYYRSGMAVTADGTKACVTQNQGANATLFCRDTTTGAGADYATSDYISAGVNNGVSFRADGSAVLLAYNQFATNCPSLGSSSYYLSAQNANGTTRWRNCDLAWSSGYFRAPVSSAPTSTYVFDSARTSVYAIDDSTGGIRWTYTLPTANVSPLTLTGGATLYMTYCDSLGTRLVSLNANTGSSFWDVGISTAGGCYMGQPVPGTGNRMYLLNGAETIALEDVDVSSLSVAQSSPTVSGGLWITTYTVSAKDSLSAATSSGVPVEATLAYNFGTVPTFAPNPVVFTDTSGNSVFTLQVDLNSLPHADYAAMRSTINFKSNGLITSSFTAYEYRAASFAVSASSPAIEDNGTGRIVQVTTITFTVSNSTGGRVSNFPVALDRTNFTGNCNAVIPESSLTPASNYYLTDSTGQVSVAYRLLYTESGNILCSPAQALPNVNPTVTAYALGLPSQAINLADARSSTFTVSYSSGVLQSDVKHTTMTLTIYDVSGGTVPGTIVILKDMVSSSYFMYGFNGVLSGPLGTCGGSSIPGYTNSLGQVSFNIDGRGCGAHTFDNYSDFLASASVFTPNVAVSTPAILVESNYLNAYVVSIPTVTSVGVSFRSTVTAVNAYGHQIPSYNETGVTLTPLFDQTAVQGTGTLGTSVVSFAASGGAVVISSQTYNKIEDIQIKATRGSGTTKTGLSGTLVVRGPSHFIVTVPTGTQAGVPFSMTVRAVDSSSTPVVGYAGTLSLSALNAGNQSLAGAGVLGVTNVNMPANGVVTIANQTYTKAESIVIRAADTGAGVVGVSTYAAVVGAGAPASITLLANPQSTIAGVPSVLTATIYDGYSNPVSNSTATFSVATGSGVVSLSLSNGSVVSAVTSTQAVTDSFGQTTAFFSSTNSLSAQANLLRASIGALARDTTVYSTVLVTSAGGAVVNFSNPLLRADIPANTYGFSVRLGIQGKAELTAADLALTTAAFAATANTFVSTTVLKLSAVRDASPTTAAGAGSKLVTVSMPYTVTSGSISVGAYGAQSILVPLSVMRIFKLNQTSSVFEQVIDGVTAVNSVTGVVTAEVSDPDGIYALGAPSFTNLTTGSSATVTTALAGGTTAEVVVPNGGFSAPATISVTVPGASAVPALPVRPGLTALGVTISVSAGGLQPSVPVTIKIGYTPAQIAGVNPDHLRLARYDATTGWVVLDSSADSETRQVIGTTDHFSLFQIVAQTPGASVSEGFVFPNPFRPSLGHTKIKLSNLPAGASIKIFTATGRLLKELNADAAGQVLTWDGTDRDGRALASGVYLAVIEGSGGRRTIKFAVQR